MDSSNINETLKLYNFDEKLDLFSLDIDGIDYWIINELPENFAKIAVIEFNPNFGSVAKVTVPNIKEFDELLIIIQIFMFWSIFSSHNPNYV